MKTNTLFDFKRFYCLTRNVLILNGTTILVIAGAIAGIALFVSGINAFQGGEPNIHQNLYAVLLFLGGFVVTGRIFKELHHKERGAAWLLLPASTLEKFTSRLFLSTLGYIVGTMIFWFLVSVVSEGVNWFLFKHANALFTPFDWRIMRVIAVYIVLQSPFLIGAVYFKRLTISKMILVFVAFSLVLIITAIITTKLVFWGYFEGWVPSFEFLSRFTEIADSFSKDQILNTFRIIRWVLRIAFWVFVAPVCWIIGYYRLKETEV